MNGRESQAYTPQAEALFEAFRIACPSFVAVDDAGRPEWEEDEPEPLGYIRIAALAWHLASLAAEGRLDLVRPILNLVEETLPRADKYTHDLLVVGLLEDLQNACLQSPVPVRLVDVRALLGPTSRAAWDELMRFWHGPTREARRRLPPGSLPEGAGRVG